MPSYTATLLFPDKTYPQEAVNSVENTLRALDVRFDTPKLIHSDKAAIFTLEAEDDAAIYRQIRAGLRAENLPVDVIIRPHPAPAIKLLISDMDSTMIEQECIDEMADMLGLKDKVAGITEAAMRGEMDFAEALEARVGLLAGLPEVTLQEVFETRITFSPGAQELVQGMRAHGAYCVLVSGGFDFFTGKVAEALGFQEHYANQLEIEGGKLTGRVIPPILGQQAKLDTLNRLCTERGITAAEVLALGDGANDLPMLEAAGLGVAYKAKPQVRERIAAQVNVTSLARLLYI